MTDRSSELQSVLLDAKLSIPALRAGTVSRTPLLARLHASGERVVALTAPAGYGKTTLLAQWAAASFRPVGWVSLDRFDDDPAALLTLLAAAAARASAVGPDLVDDLSGAGPSVLGRSAPRLAAALRSSPVPFVLMLDDLHTIRSTASHDVLGVVLAGIPPGSQLVVASREEQPHVPRLRALGAVMELGPTDLALDAAGTRAVFAASDVEVTDEVAAAVTARTEGWPVGVYLASVIARDGGEAVVTGDDRYVADYLQRESFSRLAPDAQRFLQRTAVLDHLTAPLCDAVLGETGSQERLRQLEASSLFLVGLDRRREWYRYHGLFREFLLAELARREPDLVVKLQLAAADWYEAHGWPAMAVEHLLATGEVERARHLVTELTLPTYQSGQIATVQRWLTQLGDAAIEQYPPLAVLAGHVAAFAGHAHQAQRWMSVVDTADFDAVPLDGSASFASGRAMFRAVVCAHGPHQMQMDARAALAAEPPWSVWRDHAQCLAAEAALLVGDGHEARRLFREAIATAGENSNADTVVLAAGELAVLAMDRGRWDDAAALLAQANGALESHRMQDYATSVLAFAASARLALHLGDATEARRQATRAMRARPLCTSVLPFLAVRARLQLARVWWSLGDHAAARHLLREADDLLLRRPDLGTLLEDVETVRQMVTSTVPAATGGSPLTPAELRLLPYLQTHLTIREIGDRLFVSRNTASSEIGSIYRKLGVSSRSEAVRQATAVGLLGD